MPPPAPGVAAGAHNIKLAVRFILPRVLYSPGRRWPLRARRARPTRRRLAKFVSGNGSRASVFNGPGCGRRAYGNFRIAPVAQIRMASSFPAACTAWPYYRLLPVRHGIPLGIQA